MDLDKESICLGERAARGDIDALKAVEYRLLSDKNTAKSEAVEMVSMLTGLIQMTSQVRRRILGMSRSCRQLGDEILAHALDMIAANGSWKESPHEQCSLEILSDKRRKFILFRLNNHLRFKTASNVCNHGYLPHKFRLDKDSSYILEVTTDSYEPTVLLPICFSVNGVRPESIFIDLNQWQGLGKGFIWVPKFSCYIGLDLAARDPLANQFVEIGPMIVKRHHVQMREYLTKLVDYNVTSRGDGLLPMYLDKPLVENILGRWKPLNLAVQKGHNWLKTPVVGVDFDCAKWYCSKFAVPDHLVCDLLTEHEWEVLARGPDGRLFPWGDVGIPGFANIRLPLQPSSGLECVGYRLTDISAFGLFDCSGNAEEWCRNAQDDREDNNSLGFAVTRGGSWYNPEQASRLASRVVRYTDYRHRKLTFRIAVRIKPKFHPQNS